MHSKAEKEITVWHLITVGGDAALGAEWLREAGVEEPIVYTVLAHAHEQYRTDLMSRAIVPADAASGFLVACALVRPDKVAGMKVTLVPQEAQGVFLRPGVNRDEIRGCEESIGIGLDEPLQLGIGGLALVADEVGLTG